mgnify:CR=1 FL=1
MNAKALVEMKMKYREAVQNSSKPAIKELFEEFFAAAPSIKAVTWTQYTPGFNDGDPCRFGVHEFSYCLDLSKVENDEDEHEDEETGYMSSYSLHDKAEPDVRAALVALEDQTGELDELMEAAFGDGVRVTVTNDGGCEFKVQDYDCGY